MALPVGVLTAIYLTEFAPRRLAGAIQLALDVLNGLPTIITGIFVYGLLVIGHLQSAYAGAFALAVVMLPLVARSAQETLLLVPSALREASLALGVSRWRTVTGVILPTTFGGILTGTVLAVARAAGETAPLLFTIGDSRKMNVNAFKGPNTALSVQIFRNAQSPFTAANERAWGAALTLVVIVFLFTVIARVVSARFSTLRR
jgi:phosphate transport system permease protein